MQQIDPARLLARYGAAATVTRHLKATVTTGRGTPGASSSVSIVAAAVPLSGRDLMRLPEGRRSEERLIVFTTTQLYTGEQNATYEADQVAVQGRTWEVESVETWVGALVPLYRCRVRAVS
jgi:hypothetical protein